MNKPIKIGQKYIGRKDYINNGLIVKVIKIRGSIIVYEICDNEERYLNGAERDREVYNFMSNYEEYKPYSANEIQAIIDKLELND